MREYTIVGSNILNISTIQYCQNALNTQNGCILLHMHIMKTWDLKFKFLQILHRLRMCEKYLAKPTVLVWNVLIKICSTFSSKFSYNRDAFGIK